MPIPHPLAALPIRLRAPVFVSLVALTFFMMFVFQVSGAALTTPAAPQGIVSLELAGNAGTAQAILASWDQPARERAIFGLGFDYLFMPVYSTTIALACVWAGDILRRRGWRLAAAGAPIAWALWATAIFDATENVALLHIAFEGPADKWAQLSYVCASIKFAIIVLGLLFAAYAALAAVTARLAGGRPSSEAATS